MSRLLTPGRSRLRTLGPARPVAETAPARTPPAALADRFAEAVFGMPTWMLQARASSFDRGGWGVPLGVATGTPSDRKAGRDVPNFWSELDLRGYRVLARHITDANPFGKGFSKLLRNYHVRKGFGWQACRVGVKKSPYPTAAAGAPADPLVEKAQRILDRFRDASLWPLKSRESFLRWCRDGEVIGRWFHGGAGRLPEFRFGEPDALGSPSGDTESDESFGIATPAGDPAGPALEYHFFEPDGVHGEWVAADRVTFAKRNTDTGVKRGLPDFFPVAQELEDCTKLVRTMLATAIRQAGTAWIEKFPGRTLTQVTNTVPQFAPATGFTGSARAPVDSGMPWWMLPQFGGGLNPWEPPGVVRKVEGDREYEAGPTSTGVPGYVQVEQAALRGCGVIWSFPEYFSGDASNANLASTISAGTPFTVEVESTQYEFGAVWERPCALKVLDLAVAAGMLTREERAQLDVEVTEPAVVVADPGKDYEVVSSQLRDKVICLDTARQKSGYDPQHEAEGVKKDQQSQQPAGNVPPGNTPPGNPPGAGDIFGEAILRENFTGTIKDAAGHERHYVDGKQVAKPPEQSAAKTPPTADELKAAHKALAAKMPQLPDDQFEAMGDYTSGAYEEINRSLREGRPAKKAAAAIPLIEKAIDSAPTLEEPVTVYRGLRMTAAQADTFLARVKEAQAAGLHIEDPAFVSTSINPAVATGFAAGGSGSEAPVVFEIAARKGLYLGDSVGGTKEMEYVLQKGTKLRVVGVEGRTVRLEQVL